MLEIIKSYDLKPGLDEYQVWRADVRPHLDDLPNNALEIWQVCFTEMFNHAIDHSEGSEVSTNLTRDAGKTQILLFDDGVGIFRKVQRAFNLQDERHAVLELTKGCITTAPSKHSGQGIFMTSRLLDTFNILSCHVSFSHESAVEQDWIQERARGDEGTAVLMELGTAQREPWKK